LVVELGGFPTAGAKFPEYRVNLNGSSRLIGPRSWASWRCRPATTRVRTEKACGRGNPPRVRIREPFPLGATGGKPVRTPPRLPKPPRNRKPCRIQCPRKRHCRKTALGLHAARSAAQPSGRTWTCQQSRSSSPPFLATSGP